MHDVRSEIYIYIYIYTSERYSVGARLSGRTIVITRCNLAVSDLYMSVFGKDTPDSLYVLLCRYIRSQATHRYISRSAASWERPISIRTKVAVFKAIILTIEPQQAGPTFARSARVNGTCTTYGLKYIYINIAKIRIIQQTREARSARQ